MLFVNDRSFGIVTDVPCNFTSNYFKEWIQLKGMFDVVINS